MPTTPPTRPAETRTDAPPPTAAAVNGDRSRLHPHPTESEGAHRAGHPSCGHRCDAEPQDDGRCADERLVGDFPVLAEVPELGEALAAARAIDRMVARLVSGLLTLTEHDLAEVATGVTLEQWLAVTAGRTHADRRMLLSTCDVLRRLPTLRSAFLTDASVSWAQVRSVVLRVVRTPRHLDDAVDAAIAAALRPGAAPAEPDDLVHAVGIAVSSVESSAASSTEPARQPEEFLALQPRLDGSGGQVFGDFGAVNFATLDAALTPSAGDGGGRADHGHDHDPDDGAEPATAATHERSPGPATTHEPHRRCRWDRATIGRARAARLIDLLSGAADTGGAGRAAGRPQLLIRVDLTTLLDRDQLPADLLTTLTGGRMWADARTVRRLINERGADLRTVVLDDTGAVLGVGRRTRLPPDWLADASLASHTICSFPTCRRAARSCDLDHARSWWSPEPADRGSTDTNNLAPVCAHHNRSKERDGWRAEQAPDGSRTWRHQRSGLTVTSLPGALPPATRRDLAASANSHPLPRTDRPPHGGADPPDAGPRPRGPKPGAGAAAGSRASP